MSKQNRKACHVDTRPTNVRCPKCQNGTLEIAKGRFGPIYKCNSKNKEDKCLFYTETRPIGKKCTFMKNGKACGALIVEGTKTIPNRCSDKTCPNRNPHKLLNQS